MCIFSGPAHVSSTRIFARRRGNRQVLVYQMDFAAAEDVAMVLPLPVPRGAAEDAVRFVSLEDCPEFFGLLESQIPGEETLAFGAPEEETLAVHQVGAFEASFVPTLRDFARLDRRLRVSDELVRGEFGARYSRHGFAVFKLRAAKDAAVHPMAFTFPTTLAGGSLVFPTVHVHDGGTLPERARFDHTLFLQSPTFVSEETVLLPYDAAFLGRATKPEWDASSGPVGAELEGATRSLVAGDLSLHRRTLDGMRANEDVVVTAASTTA